MAVMELTAIRYRKLSDICADIGQVALASIAIPFFFDTFNPPVALLGAATAIMFWYASLLLLRTSS